jgi:hypothetical protein
MPSSAITPRETVVRARTERGGVDNSVQLILPSHISEAARRTFGKQEAAAFELGKKPGNFSRDLRSGRLTAQQLEALGDEFLGNLGQVLVEHYSTPLDPREQALREIPVLVDRILKAVSR